MQTGREAAPDVAPLDAPAAGAAVLALFTAATFLGAALVFLVQPMVAKMVLPLLGGSPMVWNTSMVFFQGALLAGYWYAHRSVRALGLRRQPWVHLIVLALPLILLPIALPAGWAPPERVTPTLWLLTVLVLAAGAPYFAVTTAGPLLQRWFAATTHRQADDPYFLYAAGNVGSLLGLLGYPLILESRLNLAGQARLWSAGYVVFVVLAAGCVLTLRRHRRADETAAPTEDAAADPAPSWRTRVRWVAFAFIPSSLMLGVTQFLTTDIASVPLLWVVPLSIYLLTFILAFARMSDLWVRIATLVLPFLTVAAAITFLEVVALPIGAVFAIHLLTLFFVGLLGHGRLAQERPAPAHLTGFFLLLSVGGVLGGLFNALVAPALFDSVLEYPLVIAGGLLLLQGRKRPGLLPERYRWVEDLVLFVVLFRLVVHLLLDYQVWGGGVGAVGLVLVLVMTAAATWLLSARPAMFTVAVAAMFAVAVFSTGPLLRSDRTFFGVYQVYAEGERHVLLNGTTIHGFQDTSAGRSTIPLSYHHPDGPIGDLYASLEGDPRRSNVGVLGLGVGTMAAYGEPGDRYTFFEIDPVVEDIATDPQLFSYLADSDADVNVVLGDGRIAIDESPGGYGLIFLNAFTSDAVPVHLLTRDAVQVYLERLAPGGILVFNVSNRYLSLEPIVAAIGQDLGLASLATFDDQHDEAEGRYLSHWVLLARDNADFGSLLADDEWYEPDVPAGTPVWTDDFSNVLGVYSWR